MAREADHTRTGSSIALLQERFEKLQKMKELRQEKELLRTSYESERRSSLIPHELRSKISSEPSTPHCQLSLSLCRPDYSQTKHADSPGIIEAPSNFSKSIFSDSFGMVCSSSSFKLESGNAHDIDTSLRL